MHQIVAQQKTKCISKRDSAQNCSAGSPFFHHEQPDKEILREEVSKMIGGAGEEEFRRIYRVIKTHQYGGVFTMSLKLHVGVVPTLRHGFNYMTELHGSPHQRKMIAEINAPFQPNLVILDGIEAFVDGGPMSGKRAKGEVFLVSSDRVAIDAVGVAILKVLGTNRAIMNRQIFDQEQIARAAELGLGASSPSEIGLSAMDENSREYCANVQDMLNKG